MVNRINSTKSEKTKEKRKKKNENKNDKNENGNKNDENENENKDNDFEKRKLRIYSYNSRGFDMIKQQVCRELMNLDVKTDSIICNQENFVLKGNAYTIRQALPEHKIFIKEAKKEGLEGRPVNGMFIAIPDKLKTKARDVSPDNDRLQGVILDIDGENMLIVNAYFPADPKTKTYSQDEDLEIVLASIENMMQTYGCNKVVVTGDMNSDKKRKNGRVTRLTNFFSDNNLVSAWDGFDIDYTHEFERDGTTYTSTLDYFAWNMELGKNVTAAGVMHLVSNTSDHHPIYCDLGRTIESAEDEPQPDTEKHSAISTKALDESDWNQFTTLLDGELSQIAVSKCVHCTNVHCRSSSHIQEIDDYTKNVLGAIDRCIESVAKKQRNNIPKAKVVPGWSELVRPFCDEAKFWNAIWISAGKPLNTVLHQKPETDTTTPFSNARGPPKVY